VAHKDTPFEAILAHLDKFYFRRVAVENLDLRLWYEKVFGKKSYDGLIGFALFRRRANRDMIVSARKLCDARLPRLRSYLDPDLRRHALPYRRQNRNQV
jgi:hypothetical protein